jgi:hypothetical protein
VKSAVDAALGKPRHAMWDAIGAPGAKLVVRAKLQYARVAKALEHEDAHLWLAECDGWHDQGAAETDGDGVALLPVADTLAPGVYDAAVEVEGDASFTRGSVWVVPAGAHLVVYDIDGTLTTDDAQVVLQAVDGFFDETYTPKAYPGAAALTQAHAKLGELGVYLTGRPPMLDQPTRAWLAAEGFAPGVVHVTEAASQALPTETGVGAFKTEFLRKLLRDGYQIDWAYGNATTDISAYLENGLAPANVFIIGKHGGESGTQAFHDSWQPRVDAASALAPTTQPWK